MKIDKLIYIIILFSINYEFISFGGDIGVFRVVILPLALIGLFRLSKVTIKNTTKKYLLIIVWFLIWTLFSSNTLDSLVNNTINIIGIGLLILYLLKYFTLHLESSKLITAKVTLTYFVPHFIYYLFFYDDTLRFSGIHKDPNFAGGFINISLMSALYLLFTHKHIVNKKLIKLSLTTTVIVLLTLVLATGSRGTILSSSIIVFLMVFLHSRKQIKVLLTFIMLSIPYYVFVIMDKVVWHKNMSRIDLIIWRFSIISEEGDNFSRMALLNNYLSVSTDYIWYGMGLDGFVEKFGLFPHNLLLDILVEGGVVFGTGLILVISYLFLSTFINQIKTKLNIYFLIAFAGFLSFLPLSAYGLKLFWVLIIFLIISNNNFFHGSESTINKHPSS